MQLRTTAANKLYEQHLIHTATHINKSIFLCSQSVTYVIARMKIRTLADVIVVVVSFG